MSDKKNYRDNIIIALSVVLVAVVIACCVLGCVVGIQGDINTSSEVALAYVENDYQGRDVLNLENISVTLTTPIVFDLVADSSITSLDVSFYDVFDDFIDEYNSIYDTDYTSSVSSGYGDYDRFVPYCFVIEPYSMEYSAITTSTSFRFTLSQYNQPLTTATSTFDIRVANTSYLYSSSTLTCYGAKLSIPIEWNSTYPGAGVLGELRITKIRIYYIEPKKLYDYAFEDGYQDGYDYGYSDGLLDGNEQGYELGYSHGKSDGYQDGYDNGYDYGYGLGSREGNQNGYNNGYNVGYADGVEDAGNYTWYTLISAVFDAPLDILIGEWQLVDGEYVLVGGMLNFEMPGLDVNFAPVLTSLFTLVILIVILRFVFSFL